MICRTSLLVVALLLLVEVMMGTVEGTEDARAVVVCHPYGKKGETANEWEVVQLTPDGQLISSSSTPITFQMGRAFEGQVAFTPDAKYGFVAQENGTIGVFELLSDGSAVVGVRVVEFAKEFEGVSASRLQVDDSGEHLIVVDGDWPESTGGVYSFAISPDDGSLKFERQLIQTKSASALLPLETLAILAGHQTPDNGDDMLLLSWRPELGEPVKVEASGHMFPSDPAGEEAIVSAGTLTDDERFALFLDDNQFSAEPNRMAVVAVDSFSGSIKTVQVLEPFVDPVAVLASPFNNAALVICGEGSAAIAIKRDDSNKTSPFTVLGPLQYIGKAPQLPSAAVAVPSGCGSPHRGRVLISELEGIRLVQFMRSSSNVTIVDHGLTKFNTGYFAITGAIGVSPQ